jgi:hypothetical protein
MAIKYKHKESVELSAPQKAKFNTFVAGAWPGAVTDVKRLTAMRKSGGYEFFASGGMTAATADDLPDPPYRLTGKGANYQYRHEVAVDMSPGQEANFLDFVADTWSGDPADVQEVQFRQVDGVVTAKFIGTKTVDAVDDVPEGALIVEVTE